MNGLALGKLPVTSEQLLATAVHDFLNFLIFLQTMYLQHTMYWDDI